MADLLDEVETLCADVTRLIELGGNAVQASADYVHELGRLLEVPEVAEAILRHTNPQTIATLSQSVQRKQRQARRAMDQTAMQTRVINSVVDKLREDAA